MSKRNSNFSLQTQLRMLMRLIPARDGHGFRAAVAVRLEADERTGEIFSRGDKSPRQHLQDITGINRDATFNAAMSTVRKLGLFQGKRVYSRGERQKGGDRLELNWDQWEEACFSLSAPQPEACFSESENQQIAESEKQHIAESESQHNKETTTVTAKRTTRKTLAGAPSDTSGAASSQVATATSAPIPILLSRPELQEQPNASELPGQHEGVAWAEVVQVPQHHARAVWQDDLGKVHFVFNEIGKRFYARLLAEEFDAADIHQALMRCGAALQNPKKTRWRQAGSPESVVREWCTYAKQDRLSGRGKPNGSYVKAGDAAPRSFGGWK